MLSNKPAKRHSFKTANVTMALQDAQPSYQEQRVTLSVNISGSGTIIQNQETNYYSSPYTYVKFYVMDGSGNIITNSSSYHSGGYGSSSALNELQDGLLSITLDIGSYTGSLQVGKTYTYYATIESNSIVLAKSATKTFTLTPPTTSITTSMQLNSVTRNGFYYILSCTFDDPTVIDGVTFYYKNNSMSTWSSTRAYSTTTDGNTYYTDEYYSSLSAGATYSYYAVATTIYGEEITSEIKTFTLY